MDLKDEQWAMVEPLLPKVARRTDGKGRPRVDDRVILNGILWVFAPEHPGMTCPTGIRHTRPATAGSRNGSRKVFLKRFCGLW